MSDLSDFQRGQIVGVRLAGANMNETLQLLGVPRYKMSIDMTHKHSVAKQARKIKIVNGKRCSVKETEEPVHVWWTPIEAYDNDCFLPNVKHRAVFAERGRIFGGLRHRNFSFLQAAAFASLFVIHQGPQCLRILSKGIVIHQKCRCSNLLGELLILPIARRVYKCYVNGNPFKCDCELLPFLLELNSSKTPATDVPLCTTSKKTANNSTLPSQCPSECRCCCTQRHQQHFVSVDCSSRGLDSLPTLFRTPNASTVENSTILEIHLPRQVKENIVFSEVGPFVIEDEIGGLDLSNNSLQTLEEGSFPEGLRIFHLSDNRLRQPPTALLYSLSELSEVSLANNPWTCDCGTLGFKKWILSKSDIVLDANRTRCGPGDPETPNLEDRAIWSLTDLDLCPSDIGLYITMAFGILCFSLIVAASKIAWTRYEMNIKVWLYSHGVTWVKERDIDRDKKFDAFMSFSHKDENFVIQELVKVIEEKDPNIRLCLHYKHFLPGAFIHENILNAVQDSKRTVLILTRCLFSLY
ncbi:protein toll [Trichonephila clavipes]|nr:protein toll [Trichonephila clavipes]